MASGVQQQYFRMVVERARCDSRSDIDGLLSACRLPKIDMVRVTFLMWLATTAMTYCISGQLPVANLDVIDHARDGILTVAAIYCVFFLYRFVTAPAIIDKQKDDKIAEQEQAVRSGNEKLTDVLTTRQHQQAVLDTLQALYVDGKDWHYQASTRNMTGTLQMQIHGWENSAGDYIKEQTPAYWSAFYNIDSNTQSASAFALKLRLDELKTIIDRYAKELHARKEAA